MTLVTVNGVKTEFVSVLDRGFAYGDGVFETCRLVNGEVPLWRFHAKRLELGLSRLNINCQLAQIEAYLKLLIDDVGDVSGVIKLTVTRGVGRRGYGFDGQESPTIVCSLSDLPPSSGEGMELPVLNTRLGCSAALAGLKHLNRLENVLLKAECQTQGVEDGLTVNEKEFVIETTHSNVFFLFPEGWKTPRLNLSGVKGVMRGFIIEELAAECNISFQEEDIPLSDMTRVVSAFCCNSIRGITVIDAIAGRKLSVDSSLLRIQSALKTSGFYS